MTEKHSRLRAVRNPSVKHELIDSILGVDVSEIVESVIKETVKEAREEVIRKVNTLLYDLNKINDMKNRTDEKFGDVVRDGKPLKTATFKRDNEIRPRAAENSMKKQNRKNAVRANGNPRTVPSAKTKKTPDKNKRGVPDKLEKGVKFKLAKSDVKNSSETGKNDSPDKKSTLVFAHDSVENVNNTKLKSSGGVRKPGTTKQLDATSK